LFSASQVSQTLLLIIEVGSEKLTMNKDSILGYVKLYKSILDKYQIFLSEKDLENIYQLIVLVFQLDDLYDLVGKSPELRKLATIKAAMISLIPNNNTLGLHGIEVVFQAMKDEYLLDLRESLTKYLQVCSKSIGASIITGYLASKIGLKSSIWFSDILVKFNDEINCLIRLANDYLDLTVDKQRNFEEVPRIKTAHFFANKAQFKRYLIYKYILHKIRYLIYLIRFKYLKLSCYWEDYCQAIFCSESVLDWAFKVYLIDRNSCQESSTDINLTRPC
jgi:hypothetical protein